MKLLVSGSRTGISKEVVFEKLNQLKELYTTAEGDFFIEFIVGGAKGVDTYVIEWNSLLPYPRKITVVRPIDKTKNIDYLFRNPVMIGMADKVLVFWNGESSGTKFVITYARKRHKLMDLIILDEVLE